MQVGAEGAAVQVPPAPLLGVVIDRQLPLALRAGEAGPPGMLGPHIDASILNGQLKSAHHPRRLKPQQVAVQLGVAHSRIMPPTTLIPPPKPTETPEAPTIRTI